MKKKSVYLKKIGQRGKITAWLVDGSQIRTGLDPEFTNFGQHFRFPFVPRDEFWIDKEAVPNERRFFIDHLLAEWQLMKQGVSYSKAYDIASAKEASERDKTADNQRAGNQTKVSLIKNIHLKRLQKTKTGLSVWLVDGRLVRSVFNIDFTEGGHDLVYHFVPKNEIWLDNDLLAKERPYVILHELYERSLMAKGINYSRAHRKASSLEWQSRRQPEILRENLSLLGWEN